MSAPKEIRDKVLVRDKKCRICKTYGYSGRLHVHHRDLNGHGLYGEIDNSMKNLILLCASCHISLHKMIDGYSGVITTYRLTLYNYKWLMPKPAQKERVK